MRQMFDALVIGGGFYGCEVALALHRAGVRRVCLVEREHGLLRRASYVNQARIHNGYHYPRDLATARSSHDNFIRFCQDYSFALHTCMTKLYAIARDSRVDPNQFERFCRIIGAPYRPIGVNRATLFEPGLIEEIYEVKELAFNAIPLARHLSRRLNDAQVDVRTRTDARIANAEGSHVTVELNGVSVEAGYVVNCTYASLDGLGAPVSTRIKRELAEIALIDPPRELADIGVTVIDGPFFSSMPFPAVGHHSLTHVRYTPHEAWSDVRPAGIQPGKSNAVFMMRDSARYIPCLRRARYVRSMFEIKAVLLATEENDGRPILVEANPLFPRIVSILGAKIDNIYDVLQLLEAHPWEL
jgi:glycine/D-amino acid oxidase-like deaminating enzyme